MGFRVFVSKSASARKSSVRLFFVNVCLLLSCFSASAYGSTISGTIELPNAENASTDMQFQITVRPTIGPFQQFSDSPVTIAAGSNSQTFSIDNIPDNPGEQWRLIYFCNSGCDGFGSNGRLTPSGSLPGIGIEDVTLFDNNVDFADVVFPIVDAEIVSGTVNLPNNQQAPVGDLNVSIRVSDTTSGLSKTDDIKILAGESSADYSASVPNGGASSNYRINYSCNADCPDESYITRGFFSNTGTVAQQDDADLVAGGNTLTDIDLTIIQADTISGTLSLPAGQTAPAGGISFFVNADDRDRNQPRASTTVTIAQGQSSADYSIALVGSPAVPWAVGYSCFANCDGYYDESSNRYSVNGTVVAFDAQTLLSGQASYADIDMNVLELNTISGELSLPDGGIADGDIRLRVGIFDVNGLGDFNSVNATILAGTGSITYMAVLPDLAADWQVSYFCVDNCDLFLSSGYFSSVDGTVASEAQATNLAGGSDYQDIDLELLAPFSLSGTIGVPTGVANEDITLTLRAKKVGSFPQSTSSVTISAGTNSTDFALPISINSSDQWVLDYRCDNGCPGFIEPGFFATSETVINTNDATPFSGGQSATDIDFDLLVATPITGTISLPDSQLAPAGGTLIRVRADSFNNNGDFVDVLSEEFTIPENQGQVSYQIDTVPNNALDWKISYFCISGCAGLFDNGSYLASGTVPGIGEGDVIDGSTPPISGIDFNILKADEFNGSMSLPNGALAAGDTQFRVTLRDANNAGGATYFQFITILDGQNATNYQVKVPSNDNQSWTVESRCEDNCGPIVSISYYAVGGTTSVQSEASALAGGSSYNDIDIEALISYFITGSISLPAGELAPSGGFQLRVEPINRKQSGSRGSGVTVTIPEGQNSETYSISITAEPDALWSVRYRCLFEIGCPGNIDQAWYSDSGTTISVLDATILTPAQDQAGIDLTVLAALPITGSLSLPAGVVAPVGGIELTVSAIDSQQGGATTDDRLVIAEGETSATFQLDVDPSAQANWQVRYDCESNCDSLFNQGFYATAGTEPSRNQATELAAGVAHSNIDFDVLPSIVLSGDLILPGATFTQNKLITVSATNIDGSNRFNVSDQFEVIANASSAAYQLELPLLANAQWQLEYECQNGCAGYIESAFYAGQQSVVDEAGGLPVAGSVSASGIDFSLLESVAVSGSFGLPNAAVAQEDMLFTIEAASVSGESSDTQNITINANTNSALFDLLLPSADDPIVLSYRCLAGCSGVVQTAYYSATGTQFEQVNASELDGQQQHTGLSFEALALTTLSGTLSLPNNAVDTINFIDVRVELNDANSDATASTQVRFEVGQNSVDYQIAVDPDSSAEWVLSYNCLSVFACQPYFNGFYKGDEAGGAVLNQGQATTLSGVVPIGGLDITLISSNTVSGRLLLPNSQVAPQGGTNFVVLTLESNGNDILNSSVFTVPEGSNSANYFTRISPDSSTSWFVRYICTQGCTGYLEDGFYAGAETVPFAVNALDLSGGRDHSNIDMTLIETNTISGTVSLLDGRVAPSGGVQIEVAAFDSQAGSGNAIRDTTVTIQAGASSVNYTLPIPQNASSRWLVSYQCQFGCDDITPRGFYSTSGTLVDGANATLVAGGRNSSGINLLLLDSDAEFNNDDDGDGVLNDTDNCRFIPNTNQADGNNDGVGDACEVEEDEMCFPVVTQNGSAAIICL